MVRFLILYVYIIPVTRFNHEQALLAKPGDQYSLIFWLGVKAELGVIIIVEKIGFQFDKEWGDPWYDI